MALHQNEHHHQQEQNPLFLLDCLFCEEEQWEDEEEDDEEEEDGHDQIPQIEESASDDNGFKNCSSFLFDLHGEDDELDSLFSKEQEIYRSSLVSEALSMARAEAVEWMLRVNAHYGFSSLTALLAINYLDRALSSPHFQVEKPWTVQLAAVTCVSLAAKVEETQAPLLLDLQVADSKYIFEAKTIQRMELLVLTSLQWKMHTVTPVSFLNVIVKRLGMMNHIQAEFFRRCERILLSLVSDSRSVGYLPSVLAISTVVSVIKQMENCNPSDFQDRLLHTLNMNKGRVEECCDLIMELSKSNGRTEKASGKRKNGARSEAAESPSGVVDAILGSDSSNDSWAVESASKRSRTGEQQPIVVPSLL